MGVGPGKAGTEGAVGSFGRYFGYWWPLAITGWIAQLVSQVQNGMTVRLQDGVAEIALFTVAASLLHMFGDLLSFMSQTVNTLGRNHKSRRAVLTFIFRICGILTLPILVLAWLPAGDDWVGALFKLETADRNLVRDCLRILSPMVFLGGLRDYGMGLLLQERRTRAIIVLQGILAGVTLGTLLGALSLGLRVSMALCLSTVLATATQAALSLFLARRWARDLARESGAAVTQKEIFAFFWPTAMTSLIFSLSRPIIFAFASRGANPLPTIAALRVAFDFAILFNNPLNQVRHLYLTFGVKELEGVKRFVKILTAACVGIFALVAFTPVGTWVMKGIVGTHETLWPMASQALMPLVAIPFFISVRNHFHGMAMLERKTLGMAVGSLGRFAAIYLAASLFYMTGLMNHVAASACLAVGFFAEMALVMIFARANALAPDERGDP